MYKGMAFEADDEHPKRLDLLVEDRIVVECKSDEAKARDASFRAQCKTYLRMLGLHVGLILNFGRPTFKEGIDRVFLDV